jgi:ketopantoate hydroxymethyltransferase
LTGKLAFNGGEGFGRVPGAALECRVQGSPLQAVKNYVQAVKDRSYPAPEHCF